MNVCKSLVLVLLFLCGFAFAQVSTGLPPLGSFSGGPDITNLGNLNVHLAIPVFAKPGRGMPFFYAFGYESSIWYPTGTSGAWQPVPNWGWRGETDAAVGYLAVTSATLQCWSSTDERLENYTLWTFNTYVDSFGTPHPINAEVSNLMLVTTCTSDGFLNNQAVVTDGSGLTIKMAAATRSVSASVTQRDGTVVVPPFAVGSYSASVTDNNGNQITTTGTGFTDTLGMQALTISGGAPSPKVFTYTDSSATARSVTVNYTTQTVQTNFGCSGITEYGPASASLVSSIGMPDGSSYSFTYEPTPGHAGNVTGRIQSITLPTGATISYTYTGGNNGIECADGSTAGVTRVTSDTGSPTTTYTRSGSGSAWTTTVTDPQGNQTVINFQTAIKNFYETHRSIYQGSASANPPAVLQQTDSCYNGTAPPCSSTAITLPITVVRRYVTLNNNQESRTDVSFNSFGLPTETDEYDFGNGAPGALLRSTIVSYASLNNIVDHPGSVTIQDGQAHLAAQTTFGYDETTPTATSGVPQHIAITGSRGNVTSINRWLNTGPSNPTTTLTYDDTGNVLTSTDPLGNEMQFSYTDNFSDGVNRNSLAYVTQVTLPATATQHITKTQYDANTGLATAKWDQNDNETTFAYDAMLRPTQINFPDGGQKNIFYQSTTQTLVQNKIDSSHSTSFYSQADSYGRLSRIAAANGGTTPYDQQDFCYDSNSRLQFQSYPYQGAGFSATKVCSGAGDSFTYDAMGRLTLLTHSDTSNAQYSYSGRALQASDEGNGSTRVSRIAQVDGLGRLTNICEVSSSTLLGSGGTPISCGLDIAATGFLTSYAYNTVDQLTAVTQGSLTNRTYSYDSLSRLLSATEPESGTKCYGTYSGSTCQPNGYDANGNLLSRTDARGVVTSYAYDVLNRLTSRTYSDGTTSDYFEYDKTYTGLTQSNLIGRLGEEWTGSPCCFTTATSPSYDAMGRVVSSSQCNQVVCRTLNYTYDLIGDMLTSTNGEGVTLTYAYDIEGRPLTVTSNLVDSNHPANLLSAVAYNALSQHTSASYGNVSSSTGLSETRSYNARGQIQSVWSQVNGGNGLEAFSSIGYAPNGQMTAVNDAINFGNWTYTYDEFNRLASAGYIGCCPQNQNYTYAYDRYGNRMQQMNGNTVDWNQTFDSKNHLVNWSYDAAGNLLSDALHTYAYDGEGRLLTVDGGSGGGGTTYTYDASGLRVGRTNSSGTHGFTYDPAGRLVAEDTSSVWVRGEAYAGGQHVATYINGLTFFVLTDWLGNERVKSTQTESSEQSFANLPFGDAQAFWGSSVGQAGPMGFTGLEHDSESNLEHTWFRQYSSAQGRWMTPDPWAGSMDLNDPQSLNRYAYVINSPMNWVDPSGLVTKPAAPNPPPDPIADVDWIMIQLCVVFNIGCGPGGPGGNPSTGGTDPGQTAKKLLCSLIPNGSTTGASASLLPFVGGTGTVEQVYNWNTGQSSYFFSGGLTGGLAPAGQISAFFGPIWGLSAGNTNYKAGSTTFSAGGAIVGGSISTNSPGLTGGIMQSLNLSNLAPPISATITGGFSTLPATATASVTNYTRPLGTVPAPPQGIVNTLGFVLRQVACHF